MPRVTVKVNGTYESIVRPVAQGILRDVMAATGMDDHGVESTLLGEFGAREQAGSKMGESGEVSFGGTSKATVTVEDNTRYDSILSTHVRSKEHPPILLDPKLGIGVYPIYIDSELTLTFRYNAANKEEALKWRDDYMIKRAENRTVLYHEIFYYIPMQEGIFSLLYHLYTLRERISGYGDSFTEYIDHMKMRELTTLTGVDGNTSLGSIAIPERQIQVTGWFDFNEPPKEEKDQQGTRWSVEFSYKCLYKRCSHFHIMYPMSVHQSHISRKYFQETSYYSYEDLDRYPGVQVIADEQIKSRTAGCNTLDLHYGIRFPSWDDWRPRPHTDSRAIHIRPMLTWLLGISPDDPKKLFDFRTMPELRLSQEIESHLRRHHSKVTRRGQSIIYIRLFKDDLPVSDDSIYLDEDLVLRARRGLDLRHMYHVSFGLITSNSILSKAAKDDLRRDPEAAYSILMTLNCRLQEPKFLDNLVSDKVLNAGYIDSELDHIEKSTSPGGNVYRPGTIDNSYRHPNDRVSKSPSSPGYKSPGVVTPPVSSTGPWSKGYTLRTAMSLLIVTKR